MLIINYKNYEFIFLIDEKTLDLISKANKITSNGNINISEVNVNKNNTISSEINNKLDLKNEEDEKKLINHLNINLSRIVRELLDNGKSNFKFSKGDNNVSISINDKNILINIESNNINESIKLSLLNNSSYIPRDNIPFVKLLDNLTKNNNLVEFNKENNLNFVNDIYRLVKYTLEFKKNIEEKNKLYESNNNLLKEINQLKNQCKNKVILYQIGTGLSIVFLIIIIILYLKKKC
jgi:hypothetical protein